ncbi:hypothetical protein N7517_008597 [Penicillium concentricum]|uniref:Zn(2)-C6 fungal-type domain-containing protein n=1 Tax=Penicillium concentricum TaxID=293559 RepID=A0A9W9V498_9EURO|nr:uncharacterized protein N7517_008597 [Penicillium concentricum]KAJ5365711.1 hypothetical protein N7517_008597 [Penicillium concentricum]
MVYCGKPSKGCGECRSRKIRCDQAQPACSQCTRAKRDCPGYRDQLSLMFRDESKSVVRKAIAASTYKNKRAERLPRTAIPEGNPVRSELSTLVDPDFDFNSDPQHIYLMRQLGNFPLEIQPSQELEAAKYEAICYFLRSNALPGSFWTSETMSNFLMQSGGPASQKAMQASVVATATAMLSRVRRLPSLRDVAHREYGSALRLLNAALVDIEEAKTNQTLGAVILLAIYEVITSRAPENIDSWTNHINGATALLDIRGPDQLKTNAGLRLFLHLRYQIIVSCLQRDARVPESLLECTKLAIFLQPAEAHGNLLTMIIAKLSNLRSDIRTNTYENDREIISAASAIEADLIAWLAALPPEFNYTTHVKSPFDFTFQKRFRGISPYDDQYHVYPTQWVCTSWNQYRSARIIVSEIILSRVWQLSDSSSLASLSEEFRLHCRTLRLTIRRLAVEICRSVPYHLNTYQTERDPNLPPPESYLGGLVLLWHLFVAGVVENPRHGLRRWVVKCLESIGHTMGIDQALAVADIVAADPGVLPSVTEEEN